MVLIRNVSLCPGSGCKVGLDLKDKTISKKKRKLSRIPGTGITYSKAVRQLSIIDSSGDADVRGTPPMEFIKVCRELNFYPSIDYAGDVLHHVVTEYITEQKDTFSIEWTEDGFLNPEYSKIKKYMEYAVGQWKKHDINLLVLTFSKTGTKFWHKYVEPYRKDGSAEVIFENHRLTFSDELGWKMPNNAPDDSAWIFYKSRTRTPKPFPFQ